MPPVKVRDEGRLERLISLAYFLSTRTEIHIDELGERLGATREQIESDLNVLMFCGLPPYSPEQLFDIIIDDDFVSMYFNDVFIKPLRLTETEKAHAVIALTRLESQSQEDSDKIRTVIDLLGSTSENVLVIDAPTNEFDEDIRNAIESQSTLHIEYMSLSSADITERIIEPDRIFATASMSYIYAYCHRAQDYRIFRSDRILSTRPTPQVERVERHESDKHSDVISDDSSRVYVEHTKNYVDLELLPQAGWILDTFPHEVISERDSIYRFFFTFAVFFSTINSCKPTKCPIRLGIGHFRGYC